MIDDTRRTGRAFMWGFECPRCGGDTDVFSDDATETYGWICSADDCEAVGFGFESRGAARRGLRKFRERHHHPYRHRE